MDYSSLGLPASVAEKIELTPYEDIALAILRLGLPDIPVQSLIPPPGSLEFPFILVHRTRAIGNWNADPRFTDEGMVLVHVFTEEPDALEKGQLISEAVRIVFRQAWLDHWHFPDMGSVSRITLKSEPTKSPDWATSAGPVQFADLPANVTRHESEYEFRIRKPRSY